MNYLEILRMIQTYNDYIYIYGAKHFLIGLTIEKLCFRETKGADCV